MLSRLLHVRLPTAKQAIITAIDLLGYAVITAAESGASFPSKRRDLMLDYILNLMGRKESDGYPGSNLELLHIQSVALSVGDWFFDRVGVSAIDCPYPCDNTCYNLVFK